MKDRETSSAFLLVPTYHFAVIHLPLPFILSDAAHRLSKFHLEEINKYTVERNRHLFKVVWGNLFSLPFKCVDIQLNKKIWSHLICFICVFNYILLVNYLYLSQQFPERLNLACSRLCIFGLSFFKCTNY